MGDGTKQNPLTQEDVEAKIKEHGGTANGLDLSGKTFEAGIDLRGLDLRGLILRNATFPPNFKREPVVGANLRGIQLEKADLTRVHLERAELHETHLEGANLWDAHLERATLWDTHLEGANLMNTHLEGANLMNTKFSSDVNLEDVDWGNYILDEEKPGSFDSAVASYRHLKVWYTQSGYHDTAAKFYYREKEAGRKALGWTWKLLHHRLALEASRVFFGYGERWWNVLYWIAALILLFAFTYLAISATWEWWQITLSLILGLIVLSTCINVAMSLTWMWWQRILVWVAGFILLFPAIYFLGGSVSSAWGFWDALYFSAVSFTALGYGEWIRLGGSLANDFIRGLGAFESLVGISMLALLLVTFVRKWTR